MVKNEKTHNELYLERIDLVPHIMSYDAFIKNNQRNGQYWNMMQNPNDGRIPMVKFETMRPSLKQRINDHYNGNVYNHLAAAPIKKLVQIDPHAEQFYNSYRYGNNQVLPVEHQHRYTIAASWLNMIITVTGDKNFIKKELQLTIDQFWQNIYVLIKTENVELPTSYARLVANKDSALKKYKESKYESLIDWRFGNKNSAKLGKTSDGFCAQLEDQQLAIIRKLARLHVNFNPVEIESFANDIFHKQGWPTVSAGTIANRIKEHLPSIIKDRNGKKVYNNKVAMQVSRQRPEYPGYYWTLDGWTVELLYQDGSKYDNRLVMVVVLDVMNNYPVGYAIGERENTELIRMALRNAVIHMQQLFGAVYRPWQLQSDRYGIKNLTPFYNSVTHLYTPAAVGNAKSKVIEPWFNYFNKKRCKKQFNWSGHNITSRPGNQPNTEKLNEIKKSFPDKQGVIDQLNRLMLQERTELLPAYKEAWMAMPVQDQITLTPEDCLVVFGRAHTEFNHISGLGLIVTIGGKKLTFDSFDPAFRALQFSTRFQLIYDPEDLSQALAVTEDGKQRFMLHNKMKVGMGFKNTTPEQLEYRQRINDFNRQRKEEIVQQNLIDDAIIADVIENTLQLSNDDETALKLMLTDQYGQQKERLQDAKGLKKLENKKAAAEQSAAQKSWDAQQQEYLNSKTDLSQYL
ncbi:MAG: hypothetical protein BGO53_00320 [Sphingobacteriales bacterium 39-19]|nr:hypothetical protein [Sphingobacteriales bacterium]OJW09137.1 MAG: hypothetical protein BGO53_00320 [Sphingobacteriales bacterium 39-19]